MNLMSKVTEVSKLYPKVIGKILAIEFVEFMMHTRKENLIEVS